MQWQSLHAAALTYAFYLCSYCVYIIDIYFVCAFVSCIYTELIYTLCNLPEPAWILLYVQAYTIDWYMLYVPHLSQWCWWWQQWGGPTHPVHASPLIITHWHIQPPDTREYKAISNISINIYTVCVKDLQVYFTTTEPSMHWSWFMIYNKPYIYVIYKHW